VKGADYARNEVVGGDLVKTGAARSGWPTSFDGYFDHAWRSPHHAGVKS